MSEQRRQRDMERARAAGLRRLQQTAAIQQRVQAHIEHREQQAAAAQRPEFQPSDDYRDAMQRSDGEEKQFMRLSASAFSDSHNRPASAASSSSIHRRPPAPAAGPAPPPRWDDDFAATVRRAPASASAASSSSSSSSRARSYANQRVGLHKDDIDVARAIASRHALRDQFAPTDRYHQRCVNSAAAASSSSAASSSALPSAGPSTAFLGRSGPFSGRSSYDLDAVLRARQAQRDRLVAQQFAEQEREEALEHAQQMAASAAALQPFEITSEWRRRWAHASHAKECGICLDAFQLRAMVIQLPCAHTFHAQQCLQPWLDRKHVCPMCRFDIKAMKPASQVAKEQGEDEPFSL